MMKIPIGMILKQIIDEKKLKAQDVADKLGVSRQTVYQSYAKLAMSGDDVDRWANALGVDKQVVYERANGNNNEESNPNYLQEYLKNLEEKFDRLLNQLETKDHQIETKDRQIEKLMDLLGKLEGASVDQLYGGKVMELYPAA